MVSQCGMSKYGFAWASSAVENTHEINGLLKDGFDSAAKIVEANRAKPESMVQCLLAGNTLTGEEIAALLGA